jgi:hypothetical protein
MTDHITDEGERIMALARLRLTEAEGRAALARMLLAQLRHHARAITTSDAHDYAYAVWAEFLGDGGRETPERIKAGVFAQVAPFLDEATMFRIATDTWGAEDREIECGADRVVWMPADDLLIVTTAHHHFDGTVGQIEMVVSPMRVTRSNA